MEAKAEKYGGVSTTLLSQLQVALKTSGRGNVTEEFRCLRNLAFPPPLGMPLNLAPGRLTSKGFTNHKRIKKKAGESMIWGVLETLISRQ